MPIDSAYFPKKRKGKIKQNISKRKALSPERKYLVGRSSRSKEGVAFGDLTFSPKAKRQSRRIGKRNRAIGRPAGPRGPVGY